MTGIVAFSLEVTPEILEEVHQSLDVYTRPDCYDEIIVDVYGEEIKETLEGILPEGTTIPGDGYLILYC